MALIRATRRLECLTRIYGLSHDPGEAVPIYRRLHDRVDRVDESFFHRQAATLVLPLFLQWVVQEQRWQNGEELSHETSLSVLRA